MKRILSILVSLFWAGSAYAAEPAKPAPDGEARAPLATAVFAGGCFWCVESDFEKLAGVKEVVSGYSGGLLEQPTYENHEGHLEAVEVTYDPAIVSYRSLTDYLLRHIDPTDAGGQFCDRGHAYTSAIFAANADEWSDAKAAVAEASGEIGAPVVTPVLDRSAFWRAEEYHQDYYKKNSLKYKFYRTTCGRDARVRKVWKKP